MIRALDLLIGFFSLVGRAANGCETGTVHLRNWIVARRWARGFYEDDPGIDLFLRDLGRDIDRRNGI